MNGFSAADMSTAAANGHAEGYQAGYADAVKAVEAGGSPDADARSQIRNAFFRGVARTCDEVAPGIIYSAAAQEAVGWQFWHNGEWRSGSPDHVVKDHRKNTEAAGIPVRDVYAAPVAAAPALSPGAAFARQLIDEGAENYIGEVFDTERGDIEVTARYVTGKTPADRLAELEARTPAAPGIDLEQFRARVPKAGEQIADILIQWRRNEIDAGGALAAIQDHLDACTFQPANDLNIGYEAGMRLAREVQGASPKGGSCGTCGGHGMIGGLLPAGGGYVSDPCPDCTPKDGYTDSQRLDWLESEIRHYGDGETEPREAYIGFNWQQGNGVKVFPGLRAAIDAEMQATSAEVGA